MIIYILSILCFTLVLYSFYLFKENIKLKLQVNSEKTLIRDQNKLIELFHGISNEILIKNHKNFINIAKETFDKVLEVEKSEYSKKQSEFLNIIHPIKETLNLFDNKISAIEKERLDAYSDLRRQIKDLMIYNQEIQKEANALNKALSNPGITGQWGEMQLRRVVEITGMMSYCDFVEQQKGEFSRLRPDMIIKLPGNRNIIVDSKAPVKDYMQAINTGDDSFMESHAKKIKSHIKELGQKAYWEQFPTTPEFVLMFLPGESFFSSAIKKDPSLIEYGVSEKVIITTPITLIALLKAISFSWQQEAIARNAKKIGEAGKIVVSSLEKLFDKSKEFEKRMHKNVEEYDKINSFIEKTLSPAAQKLKNLGIEIEDKKEDHQKLDSQNFE